METSSFKHLSLPDHTMLLSCLLISSLGWKVLPQFAWIALICLLDLPLQSFHGGEVTPQAQVPYITKAHSTWNLFYIILNEPEH